MRGTWDPAGRLLPRNSRKSHKIYLKCPKPLLSSGLPTPPPPTLCLSQTPRPASRMTLTSTLPHRSLKKIDWNSQVDYFGRMHDAALGEWSSGLRNGLKRATWPERLNKGQECWDNNAFSSSVSLVYVRFYFPFAWKQLGLDQVYERQATFPAFIHPHYSTNL